MAANDVVQKRALLIGINYYPNLPESQQNKQLEGCVNDVLLFSKTLQDQFQFPAEKIQILLSEKDKSPLTSQHYEKPTKENIEKALKDLVSVAQPDERVVIFYSGHGSQLKNDNKKSGWNETIRTCDLQDITDDEIHNILEKLCDKTSYVTLIFDSCHSGSITRDPFGPRSRFLPPLHSASNASVSSTIKSNEERPGSGWLPLSNRYVLLAACHGDESAFEFYVQKPDEVVCHGAFTYHLCQELLSATAGMTYHDIFEKSSPLVTRLYSQQHPQVEGHIHREIFGVKTFEPQSYLIASKNQNTGTVTLAGGSAHGVTEDSEWSIHLPGTKHPTKGTQIARVKVTKVWAIASASKIEGPDVSIPDQARAFEEVRNYEMKLPVRIVIPLGSSEHAQKVAEQLKKHITEDHKLLAVTESETQARITVYLVNPRQEAKPGDPVPQLKNPIEKSLWIAVNQQGKQCFPACDLNNFIQLVANINRMAKNILGLELQNRFSEAPLQGKIEMKMLKRKDGGAWQEAKPSEKGGRIVIHEGEHIAFQVTNKYSNQLFISILEFAEDGSIQLFDKATVQADQTYYTHTNVNEDQMFISEHFLSMLASIAPTERTIEPEETFKVFATTQPADFASLTQEHYRGRKSNLPQDDNESLLGKFLDQLATGTRITGSQRTFNADWITAHLSITIKPTENLMTWLDSPCNGTWNEGLWEEYVQGKPTAKGDIFMYVAAHGPEVTVVKEKYTAENPVLDVVLIHGIFGDEEYSWTNQKNEFWPLWLKDSWKKDIRILTVRHKGTHGNSTIDQISLEVSEKLTEFGVGDKPILFICHSMGGIIAKKVLCLNNTIASNTKAIVFYGTPHDGSIQANRLVRYKVFKWRTVTATDLSEHSTVLQNIQTDFFTKFAGNCPAILSFIETKSVNGFHVVTEDSARCIKLGQFEPVSYNHVDICKPLNQQTTTFTILLTFLGKLSD